MTDEIAGNSGADIPIWVPLKDPLQSLITITHGKMIIEPIERLYVYNFLRRILHGFLCIFRAVSSF